ncbi:hypothetical protein BC939DRAFT_530440 [Gamsiella multidivaricata]|uniref:uncharacterized protein n=1 Tax=Gamsiella multidivaricata TaxID=101098 RepID=UPI00221F0E97|nr:uncharacterized protein BC939DRAFT_530440 [Gamsiella multidivaricata]KAI7820618.1 hypothetical protein BC939DRAFT_530440 [Gamsiella multidivaricata]
MLTEMLTHSMPSMLSSASPPRSPIPTLNDFYDSSRSPDDSDSTASTRTRSRTPETLPLDHSNSSSRSLLKRKRHGISSQGNTATESSEIKQATKRPQRTRSNSICNPSLTADQDCMPDPGSESVSDSSQERNTRATSKSRSTRSRSSTTAPKPTRTVLSHKKMYACLYPGCEKSYTKPSRLKQHELVHTDERPYRCYELGCTSSFRREDHLAIHIKGHGSSREFRCFQPGCTKAFYTQDKLTRHLKSHDSFVVPPETTATVMASSAQTVTGTMDNDIKSEDGNSGQRRISLSSDAIQRLADQIEKEKPYVCTWEGCFKRFKKHRKLKTHVCMVHEGCKPYPCTYEGCEMSFQTPSKLQKHQLGHSDVLRYACGYPGCGSYFTKWSLLQKHTKLCHKSIPCSVCGKMVPKSNMKAHVKTHDASRPVVPCTYEGCTKVYSTEYTLATHIKSMHNKDPDAPKFKCEYDGCNVGYEYKHVLERHIQRVHLGPKIPRKKRSDAIISSGPLDDLLGFTQTDVVDKLPYACNILGCERRYTTERLLRRHLRSQEHRTGDTTGAEAIQSMEEAENQAIRDIIDMSLEGGV